MEYEDARQWLDRDQRFIESRGGSAWLESFVRPFYLKMNRLGSFADESETLVPLLQVRAFELTLDDIAQMVTMQWRVQVAAAWFAVARSDPSLSEAVHNSFQYCYWRLTAPSLAVAVLTYQNRTTAGVLRAYRDRDVQHRYGSAEIITSALRRLGDEGTGAESRTPDDQHLNELLARAQRIQGRP